MANNNKEKLFREEIYYNFSTMDNFDKINYAMCRLYDTFNTDNTDFKKLTVAIQFGICNTAYKIAINSKRAMMRESSLILKAEDKLPGADNKWKNYDPEYGYIEPKYIEIIRDGKSLMIEEL